MAHAATKLIFTFYLDENICIFITLEMNYFLFIYFFNFLPSFFGYLILFLILFNASVAISI